MKNKIILLLTIYTLSSCAHFEKKAPCDFDNYKTKNPSLKEDLTTR